MSEASSDDANKPMEQPKGNLPVTTDDYDETLKLRKVSKTLRALVDKQIPACKTIVFDCKRESTIVKFENHTLIYDNHGNELGVENDAETDEEENDDEVEVEEDGEEEAMEESDDDDKEETDDDTIRSISKGLNEAAFDDLASTLKNPRLQLEELYIDDGVSKKTDSDRNWNRVHCALKSLDHQLSVKSFGINVSCGSSIASILRHLKPGVLKRISLGSDWIDGSNEMDQVARLEQWKQAEELELQFFNNRFPMKYATHFKRFVFEEFFIDEDKFIRIRDVSKFPNIATKIILNFQFLSKLQNFEHCILSCWEFSDNPNSVHRLLGAPVSSNTTEEIFRHSIPDSDDYFEFTWSKGTDDVEIEKKKGESH
ncbi:hypothetical protein CAEBREN_08120 [Caenorhabditis brenneri]|uniref:DUF38 domain-containing protein n=1 Tax=Caenorhabditis brenneri TaxID=135651 RepID=G0N313_CAEBE|nr:hypothetical protein CAEBREN_08120 [Caenorhabditis brenneri]